jgi:ParB family chromosome partitioning protein
MDAAIAAENFVNIPLTLIAAGSNPRKYFDPAKLEELTASVRVSGIIQPILVRPSENGLYSIVAGERRFRAAIAARLKDIPAVIKEMSDAEAEAAALVENTVRDDMSVSEEAVAAGKILERVQGDRAEAAKSLGWPLSKLNRRIALLNLCPEAMDALTTRKILVGHAELLATIPMGKQERPLANIIEKNLTVQQVKDSLIKLSTDFKSAIFDTTACVSCGFNSTVQSSLFSESIGVNDRCTSGECFKAKTAEKIEEIKTSLSEEVQTVKVLEVGDSGFTKLIVDGATGVGAAQYEACKLCSKLGATLSNIPGEVGQVEREICFDTDCNIAKIAERIKAEKTAAKTEKKPTQAKTAGSTATAKTNTSTNERAEPNVASLSQKVIEYRRKQVWEPALRKELAAQIDKAKSFALDLLLTGDGRLISKDTLVGFFGKISGTEYPNKENYSDKKVGFPEVAHGLDVEQFDKVLAAAAVSAISSSEIKDERIKKLLTFLECDLSKHFTLTADLLTLLTKTEIEAVCVSVGLDKVVKDFKKVMSGKRDEAIKTILAADFLFKGAVPPLLFYA